ncbi:MAG TPA: hypothetical protein VN794_06565 [Methylomirabilota bacterium]|jgi:hypothetical protein|nr:hypothetical protein [Methylomirabilota bacterium]
MAQGARVSSVEALEAFRATLIVYLSKARPTLEEVSAEVMRIKLWLENDQRMFWEAQAKRRLKALEQAQADLFSARISNLREETSAEQVAYHRARRALDEAEDKLRVVKRWNREFDSRAQPLVKQMEKLHTFLAHDLMLAINYLGETAETLHAYAGLQAPSIAPAPPGDSTPPPASEEPPS